MKKAICIATILLAAGSANADVVPLQIVASGYEMPAGNHGVPGAENVLSDPSILDNGQTTHLVDYSGNSVTINIWANLGLAPDKVWNGLGFGVYTTGSIMATVNLDILSNDWNVHGPSGRWLDSGMDFPRWNTGSDSYGDSNGDIVTMAAIGEAGLGGVEDYGIGATTVYDWDTIQYVSGYRGDWFKLGTITVSAIGGGAGEVYLTYRPTNFIGGSKGESIIYYGYGANGIINADENIGVMSNVPLVTLNIPEPASLILLAIAGLAIRRR
ncbi:MAG: PEP-CTERM sorting domain-containing protein [Phycisphaerae bacterium]|nr:PEP-CTERM sorting domain-containing protein [Phycisphaerae bacterium]